MRSVKKIGRVILYVLGSILLLFLLLMGYLIWVSRVDPPRPGDTSSEAWQRSSPSDGFYTLQNSWLRKSKSGLYEMYVEGKPFERGVVNGKLSMELIQQQEEYFNDQITKMIPGKFYLHFLKYFVGWFNRHLDKNVNEEYKEEIYGISQSASHDYDYIGTNYQRILNYHAAHDIGHALQNLALVGCTSFGTWNGDSADSTMIIGRNFDFYVGDHFSENKIVAFINPSEGYKFMSVTWGGFIGVVSGMNEKGLTVTINAAKSSIPSGSATPVSLVAREILQYAQNINEAIAIARKRKMFVSESFLVASAEDNRAVTIEKTPDSLSVYDPEKNQILCTNHFQSEGLDSSQSNKQQIRESASAYRYARLLELLKQNGPNTVQKTINILRDRKGLNNEDIGLGNEKAINQLIAHHSIVFEPQKLKVWVSTSPWQLGEYVCYDLNKVFARKGMKTDQEISDSSGRIAADSFLLSTAFRDFERFRTYKQRLAAGEWVQPDSIVNSNPSFYHAYVLAGDELFRAKQYKASEPYYANALGKTIATKKEELYIRKQLEICESKLKGK
jgi:predicted choloylglycine hydrolase